MTWFIQTVSSSLGKKFIMAASGLLLGGFLVVHAAGNTTILLGRGPFLSYAGHLHGLGPLLAVVELVLLTVFLVHVITGLVLFVQNREARDSRYAVRQGAGGRTWGSASMPYTGLAIFGFLLLHLYNFQVVAPGTTIADKVAVVLGSPVYSVLYLLGLAALALHVSHGFWSLFQTLGISHPKYDCVIRVCAWLVGGAVIVAFTVIVLLLLSNSNHLR